MSAANDDSQARPNLQTTASGNSIVKDVIQAVINGQVIRDVHIGNKIYTRSELEELRDYMRLAVTSYTTQMGRQARLAQRNKPDIPYRSLDYFDLNHTAVFFGRQDAVKQFLTQIKSDNQRLTLLHAPSGAGKTSFIRAGLEPALWTEEDIVLYARAFTDPIAALKQVIVNTGGPGPDLAHLTMYEFLQWFRPALVTGQRLIIFLDQFEEFFIHLDETTRTNFIEQVGCCLEDPTLPLRFVLSLRKDYLAEMETFKERIPDVFHNTFLLPSLTRDQATAAITKPTERYGLTWVPEVTERILDYLAKEEIAPPQLQLICTRLYERAIESGTKQITRHHVDDLGGLAAILKDYLGNEMQALRGPRGLLEREEVGWRLLKTLVTTQGTKVPRTPDYLREHVEAEPEILMEVLATLVQQRILRKDSTPQGEAIVEIAHETLAAEIQTRQSPQEIRTKAALELIERELLSHRTHGTLMGEEQLLILNEYKNDLPQTGRESIEFVLRSAILFNYEVEFWLKKTIQIFAKINEVVPLLLSCMETTFFKLYRLEQRKAYYGTFDSPLSLVNEISDTKQTIELISREVLLILNDNETESFNLLPSTSERISLDILESIFNALVSTLNEFKEQEKKYIDEPPNSLLNKISETTKMIDLIQHMLLREPQPNLPLLTASNPIDLIKSVPDRVLTRKWLELQERRARYTALELPIGIQIQQSILQQYINKLVADLNYTQDQVLGKTEFAKEWLISLKHQFFALRKTYDILLNDWIPKWGGLTHVPLDVVNAFHDVQICLIENILERWNDFEDIRTETKSQEVSIIKYRILQLHEEIERGKEGWYRRSYQAEEEELSRLTISLQRFGFDETTL